MNRLMRNIRLVPIVLCAAAGLFALKLSGIIIDGGYTLGAGHLANSDRVARDTPATVTTQPAQIAQQQDSPRAKSSWAQEMFGYPDVTGSVGGTKPAPKEAADQPGDAKKVAKPAEPKPAPAGIPVSAEANPLSAAERALLERLSERRQELDRRQSELDMQDTLLKAAEKRLEARINELKEVEARILAATEKKEEADSQRLKSLVTMYESMKAKEAAKIFERLEIKLATQVASRINPRRMSDILAQMSPETAERLTVQLADRNVADAKPTQQKPAELPKIEGRPRGS